MEVITPASEAEKVEQIAEGSSKFKKWMDKLLLERTAYSLEKLQAENALLRKNAATLHRFTKYWLSASGIVAATSYAVSDSRTFICSFAYVLLTGVILGYRNNDYPIRIGINELSIRRRKDLLKTLPTL